MKETRPEFNYLKITATTAPASTLTLRKSETLLQRLQREFWEKNGNPDRLSSMSQFHPDIQGRLPQVINDLIAHTLKQASEEFLNILNDEAIAADCLPLNGATHIINKEQLVARLQSALTDDQKLLLGEDNENVC